MQNLIFKKTCFSVLQRKITYPTHMIVNLNYLLLHRDQLIQLYLDISISESISDLVFGHLGPMTSF